MTELRTSGKCCRNKGIRTEWRLQKYYALWPSLTLFCAHGVAVSNSGVIKITKAVGTLKADSHIACCAHAAPMPFPCYAVPLRV